MLNRPSLGLFYDPALFSFDPINVTLISLKKAKLSHDYAALNRSLYRDVMPLFRLNGLGEIILPKDESSYATTCQHLSAALWKMINNVCSKYGERNQMDPVLLSVL